MSERRTVAGMSTDKPLLSDPEPENRCPEGECVSIAHADPNANQDRDSNYWICARCGGDLCSACNSRPAPFLGAFCTSCDAGDADQGVFVDNEHPSQVENTPWVWAEVAGKREARRGSGRGGKWMIFAKSWAEHDANWHRIVGSLEHLGGVAKASTRHREPGERGAIMVYTDDVDDLMDVMRVLGVLRDLGFDGWLSYKADATTHALVYGHDAASYVSRPGDRGVLDRRARVRARVEASPFRVEDPAAPEGAE